MPDWISYKIELRLPGEISTTLMAERKEELKSLLMRMKDESEKVSLKLNIKKKLGSWHLVPSLHGLKKGKKWKQRQVSLFLGSKNHCRW